MKVTALNGQSLIDVALQCGGTVEAVFEIARLNNLSITADLASGQQVEVPDVPVNVAVVNYYSRNSISPATAIDDYNSSPPEPELYVDEFYVEQNYIENG
jgi:hypothetical protein